MFKEAGENLFLYALCVSGPKFHYVIMESDSIWRGEFLKFPGRYK